MCIDPFHTVDLPAEVDFAQLQEAECAPIREAASDMARGLVHGARHARQALNEIPEYVDSNMPLWAKIAAFPVLAHAGISIGIFKSSYDTVSNLPSSFMGIAEGRVGLSDIGNGMWQMVKNDVAAIPEVAQLILQGRIMTAESRMGEVAFDVAPLVTGVGALKSVPQSLARLTANSVKTGTLAVRGALSTFGEVAESVAQTLRLEPEFAMAGVPSGFKIPAMATDGIPAHAMAMSRPTVIKPHHVSPKWLGEPIGLAKKKPNPTWHPPTSPVKTPPPQLTARTRVAQLIEKQWGLDNQGVARLREILSKMDEPIRGDTFGMSFSRRNIPTGMEVKSSFISNGKTYTVCYNPADATIHLNIQ